jgi:hypothetical protein
VTGPLIWALQIRIAAAPVEHRGPAMVPSSTSRHRRTARSASGYCRSWADQDRLPGANGQLSVLCPRHSLACHDGQGSRGERGERVALAAVRIPGANRRERVALAARVPWVQVIGYIGRARRSRPRGARCNARRCQILPLHEPGNRRRQGRVRQSELPRLAIYRDRQRRWSRWRARQSR